MISYPLREYISSKKDDDYQQSFASSKYSTNQSNDSTQNYRRWIYLIIFVVVLIILSIFYSYNSYIDPTCFKDECVDFVCQAYDEGLIGGHLCPELCTTKTLQLENCLGEHKHFRSRLFDDNQGNEVIRCYLRHPLSKSSPTIDVKRHFNFPAEDSSLDEFSFAIQQRVQKMLQLVSSDVLVDKLVNFADFNKDGRISLRESRSLWSLIQIDEFIYAILLSDKVYTPKIRGTCGHLFALEKVAQSHLPFTEKQELLSSFERPNWYQRVRIAVGIIEFFNDVWHFEDTDEHLYLCKPLVNSFGFDKDYESKMLKSNHLISSKSLKSRLPIHCHLNTDCLYDSYCSGFCNQTLNKCQIKQFNKDSLNELCSLVSSLVTPDSNSTFLQQYQLLNEQCQQIVTDGNLFQQNFVDLVSLQIRQTLLLQNLKNFLWENIEYQMAKITKKSTKKPTAASVHTK